MRYWFYSKAQVFLFVLFASNLKRFLPNMKQDVQLIASIGAEKSNTANPVSPYFSFDATKIEDMQVKQAIVVVVPSIKAMGCFFALIFSI